MLYREKNAEDVLCAEFVVSDHVVHIIAIRVKCESTYIFIRQTAYHRLGSSYVRLTYWYYDHLHLPVVCRAHQGHIAERVDGSLAQATEVIAATSRDATQPPRRRPRP